VQIGAVTGLTGQRQWRDGIFAQDDFKLNTKLTVNIGVRWEFDQPIYEVNNKMANVNMQTLAIEYAGKDGNSIPTTINFSLASALHIRQCRDSSSVAATAFQATSRARAPTFV
jgi:outer membrane receptor protein involved in Fe transport